MVDLKKLRDDVNRVKDAGFLHSALTCDEAIEIIEKLEAAQKDAARYQWLTLNMINMEVAFINPKGEFSSIDWTDDGREDIDGLVDAAMASKS